MKVVCKINNLNSFIEIEQLDRLGRYISMADGDVDLEIGKEYVVYGVVFWDGYPWYYVCSEDYDEYPKPFAADFFDVTDNSVSPYWVFSPCSIKDNKESSMLFKEWAEDAYFYENLLDGDPQAEALFLQYKLLIK